MNPIKTLWNGGNADGAARRDRIAYPLTMTGIVILLPLLAKELPKSDPGLGIQILFIVLILAINGFALFKKKRAPISHALVVIPMTASLVMSLREHGFYAALFCYPAVVYFYSVLSRQIAHACVAVMLAIVTSTIYSHISIDIAIIFGMTLLVTVIFVNLVFNALSDMTDEVPGDGSVDPLTNAIAQPQMDRYLRRAIKISKKRNTALSGLRIELDQYANIRTIHGQDAADNALKGAAFVIRKRLRDSDFLFRYGESGFFALLPNTPEEGAAIVSEQLRKLVLKAELVDNDMGCISIGVGQYVKDEPQQSWVEATDALVKAAADNGGNQIACRHPDRPAFAGAPAMDAQATPTIATTSASQ